MTIHLSIVLFLPLATGLIGAFLPGLLSRWVVLAGTVAGHGQILMVPDLEAGNMLAKNLTFLSRADAAGVVLGARVPIVLTSRADSVRTRLASCAVAALYANALRRTVPVPAV